MGRICNAAVAAMAGLGMIAVGGTPAHAGEGAAAGMASAESGMQLAHMTGQQGGAGMMVPGYGMGPGYGYGPGAGYGMGPGMMMGHGMMGYGMGPGMMGPGHGDGPGYGMGPAGAPDKDLSVDDVRSRLEGNLAWHGNKRLKVGDVTEEGDDTIVAEIVTQDGSLVQRFQVDRHTGRMQQVE